MTKIYEILKLNLEEDIKSVIDIEDRSEAEVNPTTLSCQIKPDKWRYETLLPQVGQIPVQVANSF